MLSKSFLLTLIILFSAFSFAFAQKPRNTPLPESKYNRDSNDEKLKKISIRLEIEDSIVNKNSTFKISKDKDIVIRVLAKSSDSRIIALGFAKKRRFTPLLLGNSDVPFTYPSPTQEKIREDWDEAEREKRGEIGWMGGPSAFIGEKEGVIGRLNIADWYGKLAPGVYKVVVLFGFGEREMEKKIQSNVITFEITP